MSDINKPKPVNPQSKASSNGADVELSEEALRNLVGFFDVLIQMDLAYQATNGKDEDEKENSNTISNPNS